MSIVLPVNISFEKWIASLQVDYSINEVPMYFKEENWRNFADATRRLNTFNNDDIALHNNFPDWQSWAERVVQALGF